MNFFCTVAIAVQILGLSQLDEMPVYYVLGAAVFLLACWVLRMILLVLLFLSSL